MARRTRRIKPLEQTPKSDCELAALWRQYAGNRRSIASRNRLVAYYLPAAHRKLAELLADLPSQVDLAEMVSAVDEAVIRLVSRFTADDGSDFAAYMRPRLRGAILDVARKADTASRATRSKYNLHAERVASLEQSLGRRATQQEIDDHCGTPPHIPTTQSLDISTVNGRHSTAELFDDRHPIESGDAFWRSLFGGLTCDEFLILFLRYRYSIRQKEIARLIGASASKVSQISTRAVRNLRRAARDSAGRESIRRHLGRMQH